MGNINVKTINEKNNIIATDEQLKQTGTISQELNKVNEELIELFLNPQRRRLLLCLYNNDLIHKDLADRLETTANSLSNTVQRMRGCSIPLLIEEYNGRQKKYSLTPIAKQYVEKHLLRRESEQSYVDGIILFRSQSEQNEICEKKQYAEKIRSAVECLKHTFDLDWNIILYERLCEILDHTEVKSAEVTEQQKIVDIFFREWEHFAARADRADVDNINEELFGKRVCEKLTEIYNKSLNYRVLCKYDEGESVKAYKLVDAYFDGELEETGYKRMKEHSEWFKMDVNEYVGVLEGIDELVKNICDLEMEDMYKEISLQHMFLGHEKLAHYIVKMNAMKKYFNVSG